MTVAAAPLRADVKVMGLVGLAHALSHFMQLAPALLFPFMKAELGVGYTELGAVLALFYGVSGVAQALAGFLVDRLGARRILLGGLAVCGAGAALMAAAPSYPWMFLAAAVGGLGNSVFHPADFALLNEKVTERRLGYAFSVHGMGGSIGFVLTPMLTVGTASVYGWRVTLFAVAAIALVFAGLLAMQPAIRAEPRRAPQRTETKQLGLSTDLRLLASRPVMMAFAFFLLYAITLIGFQTLGSPTLTKLYQAPIVLATSALTGFLIGAVFGILAGGVIAARTQRHDLVATVAVSVAVVLALTLASGLLPLWLLVPVMSLAGFTFASAGPSRDILVRQIAPAHARGKVYGFVYSAMDLGGLIAPLAFGWALDHDRPAWVFMGGALLMLLAIPTLFELRRRGAPARPTAATA